MCFLESPLSVSALWSCENTNHWSSVKMMNGLKKCEESSVLVLYLLASPVDFCRNYKTWTSGKDRSREYFDCSITFKLRESAHPKSNSMDSLSLFLVLKLKHFITNMCLLGSWVSQPPSLIREFNIFILFSLSEDKALHFFPKYGFPLREFNGLPLSKVIKTCSNAFHLRKGLLGII